MMFAKNELMREMKLFDVVAEEFPTLATFLVESKRSDYKSLATDCQRFESTLMIDGVAGALVKDFPVVTVHDSIISTEKNAERVAIAIRNQFATHGLNVSIRRSDEQGSRK